jgi:hypothetical protein
MDNLLLSLIIIFGLLDLIMIFGLKWFNELFFTFGLIISKKQYFFNKKNKTREYYREIEFKKINNKTILFILYQPHSGNRKPFVEYFGEICIKGNNIIVKIKNPVFEIPLFIFIAMYFYNALGVYNIKSIVIYFGIIIFLALLIFVKRKMGINKINNTINEMYNEEYNCANLHITRLSEKEKII